MIRTAELYSRRPALTLEPTHHHARQQLAAEPQRLEARPAAALWEVLPVAAHVCKGHAAARQPGHQQDDNAVFNVYK